MHYIDLVRARRMEGLSLIEAVYQSVDECIERNILKDFLIKNKSEAIKMSIYEYNEAEEKEKMRLAEREYGYELGREEEHKAIIASLAKKLLQKGESVDTAAELFDMRVEDLLVLLG